MASRPPVRQVAAHPGGHRVQRSSAGSVDANGKSALLWHAVFIRTGSTMPRYRQEPSDPRSRRAGSSGFRAPDTRCPRSCSIPGTRLLHRPGARPEPTIATRPATRPSWRRGWDSNPRNLAIQRFSRAPPSTARPPLRRQGYREPDPVRMCRRAAAARRRWSRRADPASSAVDGRRRSRAARCR